MTLNVVVKCPDGVVMGADSLLTMRNEDGEVTMVIPYYSKLFPLSSPSKNRGNRSSNVESYAAGVTINGDTDCAGRPIPDMIEEFIETYEDQPSDDYSLETLAQDLAKYIQVRVDEKKDPLALEILVGGYSKGDKGREKRFGEVYSIFWRRDNPNQKEATNFDFRHLYDDDEKFGSWYGGQNNIPDRFLYGTNETMTTEIIERGPILFNQARNYIFEILEANSVDVKEEIKAKIVAPPIDGNLEWYIKNFNILNLLTKFENFPGFESSFTEEQIGEYVSSPKFDMAFDKNRVGRLETMERFFSLQTAVNYCTFLLWCAYAESEFTPIIPIVGSEMKVATITRQDGFNFRKLWEIQTPGPPFR